MLGSAAMMLSMNAVKPGCQRESSSLLWTIRAEQGCDPVSPFVASKVACHGGEDAQLLRHRCASRESQTSSSAARLQPTSRSHALWRSAHWTGSIGWWHAVAFRESWKRRKRYTSFRHRVSGDELLANRLSRKDVSFGFILIAIKVDIVGIFLHYSDMENRPW
jgi:hypothetical protein